MKSSTECRALDEKRLKTILVSIIMTTCSGKEGCKGKIILDGMCCRHLTQQCSICFDNVGSTNTIYTKRLSCGHAYHVECILNWFVTSNECPICRAPQENDITIKFKNKVEDNLRQKYRDAIQTLEEQVLHLRMTNMILASFDEEGSEFVFNLNNRDNINV
jgi:hypothetical protein